MSVWKLLHYWISNVELTQNLTFLLCFEAPWVVKLFLSFFFTCKFHIDNVRSCQICLLHILQLHMVIQLFKCIHSKKFKNYFQRGEVQACIQYLALCDLVEDEEEVESHELWPHIVDNFCYSGDASQYNFCKLKTKIDYVI